MEVGDLPAGLPLLEEAATRARRVLGEAHPLTQSATLSLAASRELAAAEPPNACADGALVGLGGRWLELNGKKGRVVGFDNSRYHVQLDDTSIWVKPANLAPVTEFE